MLYQVKFSLLKIRSSEVSVRWHSNRLSPTPFGCLITAVRALWGKYVGPAPNKVSTASHLADKHSGKICRKRVI